MAMDLISSIMATHSLDNINMGNQVDMDNISGLMVIHMLANS